MLKAYSKLVIGEKAESKEQEFRKAQCESCVLLLNENGSFRCNKHLLASDNDDVVKLEVVEKANYPVVKENGVVYAAVINNKMYKRGCGCPLSGANAKWKFSFEDSDLERTNGTASCPRNRWTKYNFEKWKHLQNTENQ